MRQGSKADERKHTRQDRSHRQHELTRDEARNERKIPHRPTTHIDGTFHTCSVLHVCIGIISIPSHYLPEWRAHPSQQLMTHTSTAPHFGQSPRSRGRRHHSTRRHHHNHKLTETQRTSPWRKSWYCTCSSASDSVMVANKQRNQKMGFGPVGPTVFQVCRATKIFRPAVRSRTLRTRAEAKPAQDVRRKDERRASCRRRADPRGEGADHPARS